MQSPIQNTDLSCQTLLRKYGDDISKYKNTIPERLYRVKSNLNEMLMARNYELASEEDIRKAFKGRPISIVEESGIQSIMDEEEILSDGFIHFLRFYCALTDEINRSKTNRKEYISFEQSLDQVYVTPDGMRSLVHFAPIEYEPAKNKFKNTGKAIIDVVISPKFDGFYDEIIVIAFKGYTSSVPRSRDYSSYLELFTYSDFVLNKTLHRLQPKQFRILEEDEQKELLQRVKYHQLPRMSFEDPIARYYRAKLGQIFEITRSYQAGSYITYRAITVAPLIPDASSVTAMPSLRPAYE